MRKSAKYSKSCPTESSYPGVFHREVMYSTVLTVGAKEMYSRLRQRSEFADPPDGEPIETRLRITYLGGPGDDLRASASCRTYFRYLNELEAVGLVKRVRSNNHFAVHLRFNPSVRAIRALRPTPAKSKAAYIEFDRAVSSDKTLKCGDILVFAGAAIYDRTGRGCFRRPAELAEELGLSQRWVCQSLKRLENAGHIEVMRNKTGFRKIYIVAEKPAKQVADEKAADLAQEARIAKTSLDSIPKIDDLRKTQATRHGSA